MPKFCLFLSAVLMLLQVSRGCEGTSHEEEQLAAARQQTENYFAYAYGYTPNLWNSLFYRPNLLYVPAGIMNSC